MDRTMLLQGKINELYNLFHFPPPPEKYRKNVSVENS